MTPSATASLSQQQQVVAKAVLRAADRLQMPASELSKIVGMSESTLSRLRTDPSKASFRHRKDMELALLFLRVFRSLDALVGGEEEQASQWLRAPNQHLHGIPVDRMKDIEGLVHVAEYLDAMRAKV